MSPDPTSPSPLAASINAGSGRSTEAGAASPSGSVPITGGASLTHDRADSSALVHEQPASHSTLTGSGQHPPTPPAANGAAPIAASVAAPPPVTEDGSGGFTAKSTEAPQSATGPWISNASATPDSRVIKRYSNRKLYDTKSSRYVTLLQIADMVRAGEDVQIIDNKTKEDKTEGTLALIISEELKASPRGIPLQTLRALIREGAGGSSGLPGSGPNRSEALWHAVFGRSAPTGAVLATAGADADALARDGDGKGIMKDLTDAELRANFERWCAAIDQRMRSLPDTAAITGLEARVQHLNERLAELERRLGRSSE